MSTQFQPYLESIRVAYEKRSGCYTQTDAAGRKPVLDLMVQTAAEKTLDKDDLAKEREKIERLPVLEGLQKYAPKHVLLVGRPGSGKSTALAQLLLESAKKAQTDPALPIPVLVPLKADRPILPLIRETVRRHKLRLTESNLDDLLFEGKLLLLLDGVNEIPQEALRQDLQQFRDNHPDVPMVFTTRDLELGGALGIEQKLQMQPLTAEQLREFVQKYLGGQAEALLGQLNDRLKDLAETPLLLKLLCDMFQLEGTLPQSRGALFRTVDQKYEEIKGTVPVSANFRRFKAELLQHLAFGMLAGNALEPQLQITRTEAEQRLEALLTGRVLAPGQMAKEWLEDLLEHHLLQVADDPRQIEFHHQLFLEYYAAEALLERLPELSDAELQREYLNYLKWTEPVALMLALVPSEAQALRVVRLALAVDWMLGARLAGEVKREFQAQTVRLVDELDVPDWLKVKLLGETRSNETLPVLEKYLFSLRDAELLYDTITALEKISLEQATNLLVQFLKHEIDKPRTLSEFKAAEMLYSAQPTVIEALGRIGGEAVIEIVIQMMSHSFSSFRTSAAKSLGILGSSLAIPVLVKALEDESEEVRWSASDALKKIGDPVAIPGLVNAIKNQNRNVVICAIDALGELGTIQIVPVLEESLEKAEQDNDPGLQMAAMWALRNIHRITIKVIQPLTSEILRESTSPQQITSKVSQEDELEYIQLCLSSLNSKDEYIREIACGSLSKFGLETALSSLIHTLQQDPSFHVQQAAAYALGEIGSEQASLELINAMKNAHMIEIAVEALHKIKRDKIPAVLPDLTALIPTESGKEAFQVILAIQANCKFYNYEIFRSTLANQKDNPMDKSQQSSPAPVTTIHVAGDYIAGDKIQGDKIGGNKTENSFPNVTAVKIFENVQTYHEAPPSDPPP